MSTKLKAIIVIFLLSIALVALLLSPVEVSAKALGIGGFFLGLLNFGWNFYTSRIQRKEREDEKKENVRVDPHIDHFKDGFVFSLKVLNKSSFELPISSVELNVREGRIPFDMVAVHAFSHQDEDRFARSMLLPPRTETAFYFEAPSMDRLREIGDKAPDDVWISVSTHSGEIERLDGQFVSFLLRQLVLVREMISRNPQLEMASMADFGWASAAQ